MRTLLIVTDYVHYKKGNKVYFTTELWNENFFDLYQEEFDKIQVIVQDGGVIPLDMTNRLYEADNRFYEFVFIPYCGSDIRKWLKNYFQIKDITFKAMIGANAVLFKLFYVASIIAFTNINKVKKINCALITSAQLVGDAENALLKRRDVASKFALRIISKFIKNYVSKILYDVDVPSVVAKQLKNKYAENRVDMIVANESWLVDWMFSPNRVVLYPPKSILFVGRLIELKGVIELVSAFKTLSQEFPDIKLGIVGDGPLKNRMQLDLDNEIKDGRAVMYGWVKPNSEELYNIYRQYDVLCLPSYSEGLPLVLLEAMANKLAIIATNINGIPEIIKHKETGLLLSENTPEKICDAFRELSSSKELCDYIANNGFYVAKENTFDKQRSLLANAILTKVKDN